MADHRSVTDEEIVSGFTSLHDAMLAGFAALTQRFEAMEARFEAMEARFELVDKRFDALEANSARFEHRMLRRFDDLEERMECYER